MKRLELLLVLFLHAAHAAAVGPHPRRPSVLLTAAAPPSPKIVSRWSGNAVDLAACGLLSNFVGVAVGSLSRALCSTVLCSAVAVMPFLLRTVYFGGVLALAQHMGLVTVHWKKILKPFQALLPFLEFGTSRGPTAVAALPSPLVPAASFIDKKLYQVKAYWQANRHAVVGGATGLALGALNGLGVPLLALPLPFLGRGQETSSLRDKVAPVLGKSLRVGQAAVKGAVSAGIAEGKTRK